MVEKIDSFSGPYSFLSNFCPCRIIYEKMVWPSVEHAFQAAKTTELPWKQQIQRSPSAGVAKKIGRIVPRKEDWDQIRVKVMYELLRLKFAVEPFHGWLTATGDAHLEEGNTWGDRYWGTVKGEGENNLGKLLMQVRCEINSGIDNDLRFNAKRG